MVALVVGWIVVVGPPPLPDRVDLLVGLFCQGAVFTLCIGVLIATALSRRVRQTQASAHILASAANASRL